MKMKIIDDIIYINTKDNVRLKSRYVTLNSILYYLMLHRIYQMKIGNILKGR